MQMLRNGSLYCLMAMLALLAVLVPVGASSALDTRPQDQRDLEVLNEQGFEPPGSLVDVGEHRLHVYCTGRGSPTVVLDAGVGASYLDWVHVQPRVARFTRVCSYDRGGYGWSDRGPKPRRTSAIVEELRTALSALSLEPPYVMVGHSFGGLNAQFFSRSHPGEVAGVVLVDSVHPEQFERFEASGIDVPVAASRRFKLGSIVQVTEGMPRDKVKLAWQLSRNEKAIAAMYNELRNMPQSAEETGALGRLPEVPLVVLTHGGEIWTSVNNGLEMERVWREMQQELASDVSEGELLVAPSSGHQIQLDAPDLVCQSIQRVVREVRDTVVVAGNAKERKQNDRSSCG
jgi:pimeloyl-ACP methyl ester carboxylesterase